MPTITIHSFAKFRELFGETNHVEVPDGSNILLALREFAGTNPIIQEELFDETDFLIKSHVIVMYNRERIDLEEADRIKVKNGDEIVLYPPVSGG